MVDAQGQKAGYDPTTNEYYNEIPNTAHGPMGFDSQVPGERSIEGWDFAFSESIDYPFKETYRMKIYGMKKGGYKLSAGLSQTMDKGEGFEFEGEIDSLEAKEYEFFYSTDTTRALYFRECRPSATN